MTTKRPSGHKPTQKQINAVNQGKNAGGKETFVAVSPKSGKALPRRQQPKTYGPGEKPPSKPKPKPKPGPPKKPTSSPRPSGQRGNSGGGQAPNRYHSQIPGAPTHDTSYTPDPNAAAHALQVLTNLQKSMPQEDFANLMRTYGGTGSADGNGVLDQQQSTGTGQMGFTIPYTVDPTSTQIGNLGAGGNINIPSDPGATLGHILNHPPNPGNFQGNPPRQYPGGGGVPAPGGSNNGGFSNAPGRPGSGPSGITGHSAMSTLSPANTRATSPSLPTMNGGGTGQSGSSTPTSNADAMTQLQQMLDQWGLGGLTGVVLQYLQQGYDSTSIQYLLTQTPEYQRRFAGNQARVANGLGALSPAEYLSTERAYQDILRSAGLPAGFYDSPDDFADWIGKDVSPTEVQSRVNEAVHFAQSTDPTFRTALSAYYGIDTGHIAAYFLDSKRAMPLLQKQGEAADIGSAALYNGLALTNLNDALGYADNGVTSQQARQAYGTIAGFLPDERMIAAHAGQQYTQQTAEQEFLGNSGNAARTRRRLDQQESALFGGSSGLGQTALSSPSMGAF